MQPPYKNESLPTISFENVSFSYQSRCVLNQVSFAIPCGAMVAFLGPSGSGKTTLLKLISGQLKPDSGKVKVHGFDIKKLDTKALYALRKKIGIVFQQGGLLSDLNVFENLAFPLRKHTKIPEFMIRDHVLMRLESVGLFGTQHLMPQALSGGMARRIALARALIMDPSMMLYDEPFTGQDPINLGVLLKLIDSMHQALSMTSILVSHNVKEVLSIADIVYMFGGGKLVFQGPPKTLLASKKEEVYQFLTGSLDGPVSFRYQANALAEELGLC